MTNFYVDKRILMFLDSFLIGYKKIKIKYNPNLSDSITITSPLLEHPSTREHNPDGKGAINIGQ